MKKIRFGAFETNSSSSHSLTINKDNFVLDLIDSESITLTGGEFGWEYFKSNDVITKANYLVQKHHYNENYLDTIKSVFIDTIGIEPSFDWDSIDESYVDHNSDDDVADSYTDIKNFIFNKNSWLFGDNDNSSESVNFYDVDIYNVDGTIIPFKYTHQLTIPVLPELVAKFPHYPTNEDFNDALSLFGIRYNATDDILETIYRYDRNKVFYQTSGYDFMELGVFYLWQEGSNSGYHHLHKLEFGEYPWGDNQPTIEEYQLMIDKYKNITHKIEFKIEKIKD